MPDENVVDINLGVGVLGPEDQGSMAFKLARAAEAPPQAEPSPEEMEAARQAEAEAQAAAAAPAPEPNAAGGETPPEPPQFKFQTIEDYDKAYKEAVQRMTAATTETAEERKAREALEAELSELRAKDSARQVEAGKPAALEARKAAIAEALKKIQSLPTRDESTGELVYPENYDEQVAEAWASASPDPEQIIAEVTRRTEEKEAQRRAAAEAATAKTREEEEAVKIRNDAEKMAAEQFGLDMTPGSADYRLFYSHVDELANNPQHEIRDKPFEEQVKWASSGVRQVLGKKIELTDAEREAARQAQTRNAVLERGVTRQVPTEPPRQRSMSEILGQ